MTEKDVALIESAKMGNLPQLKQSLAQGASLKALSLNGLNALHLAAFHGHPHLISYLLKRGLDIEATSTSNRRTALEMAVIGNNAEIVKLLLQHGAKSDGQINNWTLLMYAASNGGNAMMSMFLGRGADVHFKDNNGDTILHQAAVYGDNESLDLLLKHSADIDNQNAGGQTPLHYVTMHEAEANALYLLAHGADLSLRDASEFTPLLSGVFNMITSTAIMNALAERSTRKELSEALKMAQGCKNEVATDFLNAYIGQQRLNAAAGRSIKAEDAPSPPPKTRKRL